MELQSKRVFALVTWIDTAKVLPRMAAPAWLQPAVCKCACFPVVLSTELLNNFKTFANLMHKNSRKASLEFASLSRVTQCILHTLRSCLCLIFCQPCVPVLCPFFCCCHGDMCSGIFFLSLDHWFSWKYWTRLVLVFYFVFFHKYFYLCIVNYW